MILCCGEALIDMVHATLPDGGDAYRPVPGGAALNVAVALGRLGAPAAIVTGISTDRFGQMLEARLAASGAALDLVVRSARPTTLAFAHLDADGSAHYAFHDENSAGRMLAACDLPPLDDDVEAVFVTGISLAGEPCGTTFETLAARASGRRLLMLDANIRPAAITDRKAHAARIARIAAMADIVKFSDEDLAHLDEGASPQTIAGRLLHQGAALVAITHGAGGASLFTGRAACSLPAFSARVADTIGAGDTFDAALLAFLHEHGLSSRSALTAATPASLRAMLSFAQSAAAITVSRPGADPPRRDEIDLRVPA